MSTESKTTGIEDAVAAVGSQDKLAAMLGCTQQAVSFWVRQGFVPNDRVHEVEQATGVPRLRLVDPKIVELISAPEL